MDNIENIILISNKTNHPSADYVLEKAGYKKIDSRVFEKDHLTYKLAHPVWEGKKVRLKKYCSYYQ